MIKTIIIDDEQHCINRLEDLLLAHRKDVLVTGSYQTYRQALVAIRKSNPDLIFLDVQLGDKTGLDLLKALESIDFDIIFTTAFDKYALEAFRFSAIDYLLKPIDPEKLKKSIEKLREKVSAKDLSKKIETLFHNLQQDENPSKRLAIPTAEGLTFIQVSNIIRFQSDINYTNIFMTNGQKITVSRTLKQFEELLTNTSFFRVHKSHLINLAYIKKYNKGKGGIIIMTDSSEIEVSIRRKDLFLQRLQTLQMLLP